MTWLELLTLNGISLLLRRGLKSWLVTFSFILIKLKNVWRENHIHGKSGGLNEARIYLRHIRNCLFYAFAFVILKFVKHF